MDIRKLESSLKMQNFYFSHCSVERAENIEDREPKMVPIVLPPINTAKFE